MADLDPLSSLNAAQGSENLAKSEKSRNKLAKDLDHFMTLLTTQLKHQDPLDPMKANEFTDQLVQFASVEQLINLNSGFEKIVEQNDQNYATNSVQFVGKTVEVKSGNLPLQDGSAKFSYELSEDMKNVTMVIRDGSGRIVHSMPGNTTVGEHEVEWDGKDEQNVLQPDGLYGITISTTDTEGAFDSVDTTIEGTVTGVDLSGDKPLLDIGGAFVPVSEIIALRANNSSI